METVHPYLSGFTLSCLSGNGATLFEKYLYIWTNNDELTIRYLEVVMMPGNRMQSMKLAQYDRRRE